jgi:hypothetical protein
VAGLAVAAQTQTAGQFILGALAQQDKETLVVAVLMAHFPLAALVAAAVQEQ